MPDSAVDQPFKWIGGRLCLDFNNTVDWHLLEAGAGEKLLSYRRLVDWGEEAGLLDSAAGNGLVEAARREPGGGERALERALAVRNTIHGIFMRIALVEPPASDCIAELNALLAESPAQVRPGSGESRFEWAWPGEDTDPTHMLWPVVWSAGRLLTSPDVDLVKTCANEDCGWLFVDSSRKHNRKWCEMGVCGNRAKARRFYARKKKNLPEP